MLSFAEDENPPKIPKRLIANMISNQMDNRPFRLGLVDDISIKISPYSES